MTENEFLITRALNVFNAQYGRDIKVADCHIFTIEVDGQSDRAYEITTPTKSDYLRIRLFITFSNSDRDSEARLEVTMPYLPGQLGDEVYVIRSDVDEYWKGDYRFDPIIPMVIPNGCIVTENNIPILTEDGRFIIVENPEG